MVVLISVLMVVLVCSSGLFVPRAMVRNGRIERFDCNGRFKGDQISWATGLIVIMLWSCRWTTYFRQLIFQQV